MASGGAPLGGGGRQKRYKLLQGQLPWGQLTLEEFMPFSLPGAAPQGCQIRRGGWWFGFKTFWFLYTKNYWSYQVRGEDFSELQAFIVNLVNKYGLDYLNTSAYRIYADHFGRYASNAVRSFTVGRCQPKEFDELLKKLKGYGVYDLTEVKFTVDFYPQAVGFRSTLWIQISW